MVVLDAFHPLNGLFNLAADALLHFRGIRARPDDRHTDGVHADVRKGFLGQVHQRPAAADDHEDHYDVGVDAILHKDGKEISHEVPSVGEGAVADSESAEAVESVVFAGV